MVYFTFLVNTFLLFRWFIVLFREWTALGAVTATIKMVDELNFVLFSILTCLRFAILCFLAFSNLFPPTCYSMQRRIFIKIRSRNIADRLRELVEHRVGARSTILSTFSAIFSISFCRAILNVLLLFFSNWKSISNIFSSLSTLQFFWYAQKCSKYIEIDTEFISAVFNILQHIKLD